MKKFLFAILCFSSLPSFCQDQLITNLNKTLNPINSVEINSNENDSKEIWKQLKKCNVIGLGEGTHGTSDFFKMKSKLIKYGIEHKNLKLILIEESLGNTFLLNNYVLNGQGDAITSLKQFGAWIYKVQEVAELIEFVKKYNSDNLKAQKVKFLGFDVQSISGVLKNLKNNNEKNESLVKVVDELLVMDKSYKLYNFWNDTITRKVNQIIDIVEKLPKEKDNVIRDLSIINLNLSKKLWSLKSWDGFGNLRDSLMYESLIQTRKVLKINKTVLWGHNGHIMKYVINDSTLVYTTMGYRLSKDKQINYYGIGFDFNKGSFKAYNTKSQALTDFFVGESEFGSTAYAFKNAKYPMFFLSLKKAMKNPILNKYFLTNPFFRQVEATYDEAKEKDMSYTGKGEDKINLWKFYDGWIYINETKASKFLN